MQLILETEETAAADIVKMSTIEETLDINLKDSFDSMKSDNCNGNKENIECQKQIFTKTVDDIDSDHKETIDNQSDLPSTVQDTNSGLKINNDEQLEITSNANSSVKLDLEATKKCVGQEVSSNGNSYENCNGISNTNKINGNGRKCLENVEIEEKECDSKNIVVNETINQEIEEISLSITKDLCGNSEETDKKTKMDDKSNSNDLETKELNILDTELKEESAGIVNKTENFMNPIEVNEDISKMIHEVDKTISEMGMVIDEDILNDADEADKEASGKNVPRRESPIDAECNIAKASDNMHDLVLEKAAEIESETAPVITEHHFESEKRETKLVVEDTKPDDNHIVSLGDIEIDTNTVCEKTNNIEHNSINPGENATETEDTLQKSDKDEPESALAHTAAQCDTEIMAVDKPDVEKMDDDVIQIESEQDSEIVENSIEEIDNGIVDANAVQDDVQKVPEEDEPMIEVDSSKSVQESSGLEPGKSGSVSDVVVEDKVEVFDVDEIKELHEVKEKTEDSSTKADEHTKEPVLKLSNTLDILSDDDDEQPQTESQKAAATMPTDKQCIDIEDDDDIMLIDEDTDLSKKDKIVPVQPMETEEKKFENTSECTIDLDNGESVVAKKVVDTIPDAKKDPVVASPPPEIRSPTKELETPEKYKEAKKDFKESLKPLLPENFLKSCKKNLADMTREELEEFCILKIVESIVDRSNLGDIKSKLKSLTQNIEEHKKKAMMLTKQNRDLQLVLKSVQEEQKKKPDSVITPLKITRSVGMQVLMTEKIGARKKPNNNVSPLAPSITTNRNVRPINPNPRPQKPGGNQQIPVPRLVPAAANPVAKSPITQNSGNNQPKPPNQFNVARMSPPVQKAEKRPHNRLQSVTVDLTDDEPPAKVPPRSSPAPPVRLVSSQNLMSTPRSQVTAVNSPRKVYIPISGPQGQSIRPGQTIMLKSVPPPGPRQRAVVPNVTRGPAPNVIIKKMTTSRHPAPLPDSMKQYQPPNWKALPPAPDLKLSKVENGIVISWKIEGYQEDSYEEIASYQLYAYQETSSPPSTALWKKIGDVKALPLPMACTLTQFMAGFKYYFAVRAVDVRSRLGPFSLPGSILLLNKM